MDTRTANPDPAQRWSALAQAGVRQRPPVHDRGTPTAESSKAPGRTKAPPVIASPTLAVVAASTVLIPTAAVMLGLTEKAIERKIERGVWVEGKHFARRDGNVFIIIPAVEQWVIKG